MGAINSSDRTTATLYCLGTWFISGLYACSINTLYKGDSNVLLIIVIIIIIKLNE
jgi:hypothetical protein